MLDTRQLADYCDRHNLSPQARSLIDHIRTSPPARRVQSGRHNVACRFASRKMGCVIQAESHKNELPAVQTWEYDPGTYEFYDQPPRVKVSYVGTTNRRHTHLITPDFFLLQDSFAGWVECKTEEWLRARAKEGSNLYVADGAGGWRYPPGEEYAASVGLKFRVRSSAETNWVAVGNANFLADYWDERSPKPGQEEITRVVDAFDGQAMILLKDFLEADHGVSADILYRMISDRTLYVALNRDLLAEPERTYVFRDELSAQAYCLHLRSRQLPAIPDLKAVEIAPGQALIWDGQPWRIANVGMEDVYLSLEADEKMLTHVPRTVLEQLVRDGKVTGLPRNDLISSNESDKTICAASPSDFAHALMRYRALFPDKLGGTPPKATDRALRKWRSLYRHATAALGSGFLGLLPKFHCRGNRNRKLDDRVIKIMNEVIDERYAQPGQNTLVSCWGEVGLRCKSEHYPAPSEETFRAEVRRRHGHLLRVAREGEKAAYDQEEFYWCLERTSPRHGERPFEIGHIDHTELDLQFVGSRRGEPLGKAWLTVMVDAFTRMVVAWVLLFEEPSYRSCMAVIRDCVRRHGRIPKTIVLDKGAEFEGIYFETLLAFLESHKKTRPGSKPRFGSVMERVFGISNKEFVHNLAGNNQALQKPRRMSKSHDPRLLAVWTLPRFREAFEGYIDRVYGEAEHPALGLSPKQAMTVGLAQSGMRTHTLIQYSPSFVVMCLPTTPKGTAKVEPARGVKIHYIHYWTPEFRDPAFAAKDVPVRYDPDDASIAFAWLRNHWAVCRAEYTADFQGRSEKEVALATQEIRARFKRTGQRRVVTAMLIAEYLRDTTVTEKVLTARIRHQESAAAEDSDLKTLLGIAECSAQSIPDQSVWDNLTLKFFGDFE